MRVGAGREGGGGRLRVAFQGERGAFSEEAAARLLRGAVLVPRPTFEALFSAVDEGVADCVVAPVENTLAGPVRRVRELMGGGALRAAGETTLRVSHCLVGCRGSTPGGLRSVESHPVALAQCRRFFAEHPHVRPIAADDTAASARRVAESGDPRRAALASGRAARLYGGAILRRHLEDDPDNFTRFLLLAPPGLDVSAFRRSPPARGPLPEGFNRGGGRRL
jgi:prephenate dehydratase